MAYQSAPRLILHIVFRFDVGGLENGIVNLINRLPAERWRHGIVALENVSDNFWSRIERKDVFHVALNKGPGHAVRLYPRLFQLCRELLPDIVHTRNLAALEASAPAWAARVPIRVHGEHGRDIDDLNGANLKNQLSRKIYRPFVQHYITMSRDLQQYLSRAIHVPMHKISQIYSGVDTDLFRPRDAMRRPVDGCPFTGNDLWVVGTVGRMQAVKAQTRLAEAFAAAVRRDPNAASRMRLVMIGEGSLLEEVDHILTQAGVRNLAWLPGERSDIPQIMRTLDCFVLPSLAEGISNTILEAFASGLPVVATRVGGNPELVEDQVCGRLVSADGYEPLADALLGYFHAPEVARRHGTAARRAAEQRFSLDRMVRDYDSLYSDLLDRCADAKPRLVHGSDRAGRQDRA